MAKIITPIIIIFFTLNIVAQAQKNIYNNIFKGEVIVKFIDISNSVDQSQIFQIENFDKLKDAFLVYGYRKIINQNTIHREYSKGIFLNQNILYLDSNSIVAEYFLNFGYAPNLILQNIRMTNIFDYITYGENVLYSSVDVYPQDEDQNQRFRGFSLVLIYEDQNKPLINISIFANDKNVSPNIIHNYSNLNPFNLDFDVSLSLMMLDATGSNDASLIKINNDSIGIIFGDECFQANPESFGSFKYQNGITTGICDDIANARMDTSDVLAIINQYLTSNNSFNLSSIYYSGSSPYSNPLYYTILAYTPNCDVFETQTSRDTVICLGESIPIFASGGQSYEWEPQIGLSCYDCPNPIFNHDSTITYTVRIWNNDSCSKVLPVRVRVHKPQAPQLSTTPSLCADSTGSVTFSGLSELNAPYTYQLLGVTNASGSFANVPPGEHPYSVIDKYGCVYEGTAIVGVIPPKAQFTANPEQGQEPLTVTFNNTSQNANGYTWIIGTDTFYTQSHTHTFDTAGQYQVLLIAYHNSPNCADTAMFTVNVFAQFYVLIPNIFTPNGDGVNDEFSFEASRIRSAEWEIFNRWGSTLHKGDWSTEQAFFNDTHIIPVWNGITQRNEPAPDGVYFCKITVKTLNNVFETFTGNVTLVR